MRSIGIASSVFALLLTAACGEAGPAPASTAAASQTAQSLPTDAVWALDAGASRLGFASVKAGEVIEAHHFTGLSGEVTPAGIAEVTIPLDRVETKIDIRNERMRAMLFETETYPVATIRVGVAAQDFEDLAVGARTQAEIEGTLSLHGVEAPVTASVFITRIGDKRIEVASVEPVLIYVEDFNLAAGLEALREIAGLPAITAASPVSFSFVFESQAT